MTKIMAHRANLTGPRSVVENSLAACEKALQLGFGLETDLRRDVAGRYYISHDVHPRTSENSLEGYSALFSEHPDAELAINVKELGYEVALIELMSSGRLGKGCFYFDFELLEPKHAGAAQRRIRSLPGGDKTRMASRLSDRNEGLSQCLSIPGEVVWADEFDALWLSEQEVKQVKESGRLFFVISPEIHGFDRQTRRRRWQDFNSWHIDGICTDYALEAKDFFG